MIKKALLQAIAQEDITLMKLYVKQGVPLDDEILNAILEKRNEKMSQIIGGHILSSSNYYLGVLTDLVADFQKLSVNSLFITHHDDNYFLCHKRTDGYIEQNLIRLNSEGIHMGEQCFPLDKWSGFDIAFEEYSQKKGCVPVSVSVDEEMIEQVGLKNKIKIANDQSTYQLKLSLEPTVKDNDLESDDSDDKREVRRAKHRIVWLNVVVEQMMEKLAFYVKMNGHERFAPIIRTSQEILKKLNEFKNYAAENLERVINDPVNSLELQLELCVIRKQMVEMECEAILVQAESDKRQKECFSDLSAEEKAKRKKEIQETTIRLKKFPNRLKQKDEEIQSWDDFRKETQEVIDQYKANLVAKNENPKP